MVVSDKKIVLASGSPRRKQLLEEMGLAITIRLKELNETVPEEISAKQTAEYLATKKASAYTPDENEIVVTADTVVIKEDRVYNKPTDRADAEEMLQSLSNDSHEVITGVCLKSAEKQISFSTTTKVHFKQLTNEEIDFYIDTYKPFDKAGAYGIQEWIGMVAVTKIEGSYFNVMGFPIHDFYEQLNNF